jgi:hypothetical protein
MKTSPALTMKTIFLWHSCLLAILTLAFLLSSTPNAFCVEQAQTQTLSEDELEKPWAHVRSMSDVRALEEYFYRDLLKDKPGNAMLSLLYLEYIESDYPRLIAFIGQELPKRALGQKTNDILVASELATTLVRLGGERELEFVRSIRTPHVGFVHALEGLAISLDETLKRTKEGRPRYGTRSKYIDPRGLPPETSPLSRPIPPLEPVKGSLPELKSASAKQPPAAKNPEPSVKDVVSAHSPVSVWPWLALVVIAVAGVVWIFLRPTRQ